MRREWRWLVLVLCGILLLIAGSAAAEAQDEWAYRTDGQLAYVTAWKGTGSQAEIPETIDGYYVAGVDAGAFGEDVTEVVFPVSVSEISDEAMKVGTTVAARHGAPALQWAEEHGYPARDLSERDFTSLIVDLTGTEYQKTEEGINLSPALEMVIEPGRAVYLPESGSAWGINSIERANGQAVAQVEEADPLLTYNEVIVRSMPGRPDAPEGLTFDESGRAVISYTPQEVYRFPAPYHEDGHLITLTTEYNNFDAYVRLNTGTLIAQVGAPLLLTQPSIGWRMLDVIAAQTDHAIDLISYVSDLYISYDFSVYLDLTTPLLETQPDEARKVTVSLQPVGRIPIGPTPLVFTPKAMLELSLTGQIHWDAGIENSHFEIGYSSESGGPEIKGSGLTLGTPYASTQTLIDTSVMAMVGFSLDLKPCFNIMQMGYCWEWGLKAELTDIENHAGLSECRDVTWTAERKGQVSICPGIDTDVMNPAVATLSESTQTSHDLGYGSSWGVVRDHGIPTGAYISKDFLVTNMNMPITIWGQEVWPGKSVHAERDESGVWQVVDHCSRQHVLAFHTGIPDDEIVYKACPLVEKTFIIVDLDWTPKWAGKRFEGWYTAEGEDFYLLRFDELIRNGEWESELHLYARWEDENTGSDQYETENDTKSRLHAYEYGAEWVVDGHNHENAYSLINNWFSRQTKPLQSIEFDEEHGYGPDDYIGSVILDPRNINNWPSTAAGWRERWKSKGVRIFNGSGSRNVVNVVYGDGVTVSEGYMNSPNLETVSCGSTVEAIGSYMNCYKLRSINIPNKVQSLDYGAFMNCYALKNITIPDNVNYMEMNVFANSGLEGITIPSSISYIPEGAFRNCGGLRYAELSETVTAIGTAAFENDSMLKSVTIPEHLEAIHERAFKNCLMLEEIAVDADYIYAEAFNDCVSLKKATIKTQETWNSFNGCSQLEEADIDIGIIHEWTFANCNALKEVEIRSEKIEGYAFGFDRSLEKASIRGNKVTVNHLAFAGSPLKELTIEADELDGLSLSRPESLETLVIRAGSITNDITIAIPWLKSLTIVCGECSGNITIDNCRTLEMVEIINDSELGKVSVYDCPGMENLTISGAVKDLRVSRCRQLTMMDIGPVTEKYYFQSLSAIEKIELKDGTVYGQGSKVQDCPLLRELRIPGNLTPDEPVYSDCPNVKVVRTAPEEIRGGTVLHFRSDYGTENEDWYVSPGCSVPAFYPGRIYEEGAERLVLLGWALDGDTGHLIMPDGSFSMPGGESTLYAMYALSFEEGEIESEDGTLTYYRRPFSMKDEMMIIPSWINALGPWSIDAAEKKVYIGAQVTSIDPEAFCNAGELQQIIVDPENPAFYDLDGVLYSRDGSLICVPQKTPLKEIIIPNGIRRIEAFAFFGTGGSNINLVSIPESVADFGEGCFDGLIDGTMVFGPENESIAEAVQANGLNYNMYPAYFFSGNTVVSVIMVQAGEELGPLKALAGDGFLGWSYTPKGDIITGQIIMPRHTVELYAQWAEEPPESVFYLPDGLVSAEEEAFYGMRATSVYIPGNVKTIQALAFAGNSRLRDVIVISRDAEIAPNAFAGAAEELTIYGYDGSTAEAFAEVQGYEFVKLSPWGR